MHCFYNVRRGCGQLPDRVRDAKHVIKRWRHAQLRPTAMIPINDKPGVLDCEHPAGIHGVDLHHDERLPRADPAAPVWERKDTSDPLFHRDNSNDRRQQRHPVGKP